MRLPSFLGQFLAALGVRQSFLLAEVCISKPLRIIEIGQEPQQKGYGHHSFVARICVSFWAFRGVKKFLSLVIRWSGCF